MTSSKLRFGSSSALAGIMVMALAFSFSAAQGQDPAQPENAEQAAPAAEAPPPDGTAPAEPAPEPQGGDAPAPSEAAPPADAGAAEAPAAPQDAPPAAAEAPAEAAPAGGISANDVQIGASVFGSDGSKIGEINGVKSDDAGHVQEILVTNGEPAGMNAKSFEVPADKITSTSEGVKLSLSADEAKQLPIVDPGKG
jgi:type IV secretory pathway VirB10-like protein